MLYLNYSLAFFLPFLTAVVFTWLIKFAVIKIGIFDVPSQRKIHQKPIPLGGGTAIYLTVCLSLIVLGLFNYFQDVKVYWLIYAIIPLAGFILIAGGLLDDKYNLKPYWQILFPVTAILLLIFSGLSIRVLTNPFGGVLAVPAILGSLTAFFWLLGMVYTTKFLDGLDGLVSGICAIGSVIIFAVSLQWDSALSATSVLALIFAGACAGFLVFNSHPAKIFLGEGGSTFCGLMLGILAIISGSKIATALLIMGIPILDIIWVVARRLIQGKSVASADLKHLHYRLMDVGLSHRQTVIFLYLITTLFGAISIFSTSLGKVIALLVLLLVMVILGFSLVYIYNNKKHVRSH